MTLEEAMTALLNKYKSEKLWQLPIQGVLTGVVGGTECLRVFVSKLRPGYVPEESKPGVGFEGFRVVSYLGPAVLISDSGAIPP